MARTVNLQAGTHSVHMSAVHLLQHTGEHFLQPLLQTPDAHGRATIYLQEHATPALTQALRIVEREGTPDRLSVPEYLKLMLTLSSCNAWSALEALTSSLVPEEIVGHLKGKGYITKLWGPTERGTIPWQALRCSLGIMTLFLPQLKTSQNTIIGIDDEAFPIDS